MERRPGTGILGHWPMARRNLLVDALLGLMLGSLTVLIISTADGTFANTTLPQSVPAWLLAAGPAWAVPLRRLVPMTAFGLGMIIQTVVWTIGFPSEFISMGVLIYSAAAYSPPPRRRWVWGLSQLLTLHAIAGVATGAVPLYVVPLIAILSASAAAIGVNAAARQAYTSATEARARELERSRQVDRERALAEERARIARELHDVVAHGLSVIVVQAAAARRILERDPDGATTALGQIEDTGRNALSEMRHVLAAIRTEPDESWRPAQGLNDLDALVAEFEVAGLPVSVERRADTDTETDPFSVDVPATVDVTAYRIVRESLTNVLKHGGPNARATVQITRQPNALTLRIVDDGRGSLADDRGGHGLRGMQERVEVFGGTFSAGPRLDGGFTVVATLPFDRRQEAAEA